MSSTRTVKVGIYGAGNHARNNHLLNLTRLEDVEVVAVCDIVVENARQAAADFGISSIYTDVGNTDLRYLRGFQSTPDKGDLGGWRVLGVSK